MAIQEKWADSLSKALCLSSGGVSTNSTKHRKVMLPFRQSVMPFDPPEREHILFYTHHRPDKYRYIFLTVDDHVDKRTVQVNFTLKKESAIIIYLH